MDKATHGNEVSLEYVVDKNPEYIFVLDIVTAIGIEGAKLAQEIWYIWNIQQYGTLLKAESLHWI